MAVFCPLEGGFLVIFGQIFAINRAAHSSHFPHSNMADPNQYLFPLHDFGVDTPVYTDNPYAHSPLIDNDYVDHTHPSHTHPSQTHPSQSSSACASTSSTTTLSLIHISEPTRRTPISYAVF